MDSPTPAALRFGGSFNPVHRAHLACSAAAALAGGFNDVVLVPTFQSLLKAPDYALACPADRLAMLELAATEMPAPPRFHVDSIELTRAGPSYTIDTVTELRSRDDRIVHWLIGADQLVNLHRWHRFDELMRLTQFWVMQRPGYVIAWDQLHPAVQSLRDHVVVVPQMDISATLIRQRVAAGEPIDDWVTPDVRLYIRDHSLYIP